MPRIELLGGVKVIGPGAAVAADVLAGRRGRVALAVLAMERGRPVDQDELAEALWPHTLPPTWRPALRSAISRVRDVLDAAGIEPSSIVNRDGCMTLLLPADVEVDVDVARADVESAERALAAGEHHLAAAAAERATAVLANPLLPREASEWAERRRARLRHLRQRALQAHTSALLACGDHDRAVDAAEELIRAEPFGEAGHRLLIRSLAAGGRRAAALRAYERCRRMLADELGVEPEPATAALHLEVLGGPAGEPPTHGSVTAGAVTSRRDRRRVEQWWEAASRGGPPVLALSGDSGSGKHDLIRTLADREAAAGSAVVWHRPGCGSTVRQLVEALVTAPADRGLVVLEQADLTADLDALLTLDLDGRRTAVVIMYRTDRPWLGNEVLTRALHAFEQRGLLQRLVMSPLDRDDAVVLLESMTGRAADDAARWLAAELADECGGNQGLMRLRVLGLVTSGALRVEPDGWRVPNDLAAEPMPGALVDAVSRWAAGAPPDLVTLLRRIAARTTARTHRRETGCGEPLAPEATRLAIACGLVVESSDGCRFAHPVIGRCWADADLDDSRAPALVGAAPQARRNAPFTSRP